MSEKHQRDFAPGEVRETQLSQPGRGLVGLVDSAARPIERKADEGSNPINTSSHTIAYSERILGPARDCVRATVAGSFPQTDLCLWEDLEIGEAFYLPFMPVGLFFKTGIESYGIAPNEPEFEWRVASPGREPVWLVARAEVMKCRRCGCDELNPCYSFTEGACAWAQPGLCTNCLTEAEVLEFLSRGEAA